MRSFKQLENQFFAKGVFKLVPIRNEDRFDIMNWRNQQIYHLRQKQKLSEEDQNKYFDTVIKNIFIDQKPNQILFSLLEGDLCIGYGGLVHVNWTDKNAELSFVMNTILEKTHFERYWGIFLELIEKVAFDGLKFHKIFTYAFDLRPKLYLALEKSDYKLEAKLSEHCFIDEKYMDIVIHSKINVSI
jgi:hypothetical protein